MKLPITIEYNSGESATYVAQPPEFGKWEKATGKSIQVFSETVGIWDLMFLAYNAMKRETPGKAVKPFEVWMDTVTDIQGGSQDPKAINAEV